MSRNTLSILVPYQAGEPWRDRAWAWSERRWRHFFPHAELVVSDGCQPQRGPGLFSHARAVNEAFERSKGRILVIADAEVVATQHGMRERLALARHGRWTVPHSYVRLTEQATAYLLEQPLWRSPHALEEEVSTGASVAPILVMPRDAFEAAGGYDPRFDGWSPDDIAFAAAVETLYAPKVRSGTVWHLYHPRPLGDSYGREGFPESRALSDRYDAARGDPAAMRAILAER